MAFSSVAFCQCGVLSVWLFVVTFCPVAFCPVAFCPHPNPGTVRERAHDSYYRLSFRRPYSNAGLFKQDLTPHVFKMHTGFALSMSKLSPALFRAA